MEFIEYADREMLFLSLANQVAGELGQALRSAGRASFAVAGGSTPLPLYDLLSAVELDWENVALMLTDERCVPEDHPRSNLGQVRKRLVRAAASAAKVVPLYLHAAGETGRIERIAEAVSTRLPLSTVVLGMGEDLHIASLFPGSPQLAGALSPAAPPVMEMSVPGQPEGRITLSLPVLRDAMNIHLVILGHAKREAFESSKGLPPELAPVRAIAENATVHWAE
ncbi:6-phosphogluconolactonase [Falsigemmobacter faecalis]|uniref:6-phosphogluconolactonase n=1 Tax=Falsigemmobacter faecalis TaxID=2488730 RepID=A0A3P3DCD9_9RHOB|nr:6-phosphogluconolactonase [Falsigemmobacter faecalis]RRH71494.1 6-phosphogluconolactonase [Falsigemmobacter faecalis]